MSEHPKISLAGLESVLGDWGTAQLHTIDIPEREDYATDEEYDAALWSSVTWTTYNVTEP
jgi:hypothetical protein